MLCLVALAQKPVRSTAPKPTLRTDSTGKPVKTKRAPPAQQGSRAGSRVVDDTTRNVYGPQTTLWTTEKDLFLNRKTYTPLDTSILNYHRWTYVQRFNNFYQDLGNNGTALSPIFPELQSATIGVSTGFRTYAPYFDSEEPLLFNTKSPYTRMYLVWAGEGRAATRIEYSRNINPKWNISFNYRPILTDKQVQRVKADRQVVSHYYDISTNYSTPNEKYSAFASFRRIRHRVVENGGITFVPEVGKDSTFAGFFGNVNPNLVAANSLEQRNQFHAFHQYALGKDSVGGKTQIYHTLDITRQIHWYRDDLAIEPDDYYDYLHFTTPEIVRDSTRLKWVQNQVGIKGNIGANNQIFYNGFYKLKSYDLLNKYMGVDTLALSGRSDEHYLGGQLGYFPDSLQSILLTTEFLNGGYSRLQAEGATKWIDFQVHKLVSKPAFLPLAYLGQFSYWNNEFRQVESLQIKAFPKVTLGSLMLSAGGTYTSLQNHIYFIRRDTFPGTGQKILPVQAPNNIRLLVPEGRLHLKVLNAIHLRTQVLYSMIMNDPDSVLRVPDLFVNSQLSFEGFLFKRNLQVHAGVDMHWHSAYKAMGYAPYIQSFYNQDTFVSPAYPVVDVFFNGKMKRGRFFVKYHNLVQLITKSGQMPTPYYGAMRNILDFGFELVLFD
jgi:hypothetical protein